MIILYALITIHVIGYLIFTIDVLCRYRRWLTFNSIVIISIISNFWFPIIVGSCFSGKMRSANDTIQTIIVKKRQRDG